MKKVSNFIIMFLCSASLLLIYATPAAKAAVNVQTPPPAAVNTKPDIVITSFGGSKLLDFAEIYNQTSKPVELDGFSLRFTIHDGAGGCADGVYSIAAPDGWLLPKNYFTFERSSAAAGDPSEAYYSVPSDFLDGCIAPALSGLKLAGSDGSSIQEINFTAGLLTSNNWARHKQRAKSSLSITGNFTDDYSLLTSDATDLYSAPLYNPPTNTSGLQILEVLPHALNCSPADTSLTCSAYIKLLNTSTGPVDLSGYRLRTSYGGSNGTVSNTVSLSGTLEAGQYKLINSKDDGSSLSLTQGGGYVWLEDNQGVRIYEPVVVYPDASADSKIGYAWAFDGAAWQWTSSPEPLGANVFTMEVLVKSAKATVSSLKPCAPDQVRNSLTHRCRKMASSVKTQVACKPGQARNPATGRCRSVLSASKTQKPCKPGQERNPDTGRCRKQQPKISNVKDIKTAGSQTAASHWYIFAVIVAGVGAYIAYEWREELAKAGEFLKFRRHVHHSNIPVRQKFQNLLK